MSDLDVPFSLVGRGAYVGAADALVLADVHLGRGAASAVTVPLADGRDAGDRLERLLARTDPAEVVVAGDLLHSFSRVPRSVERDLERFRKTVSDAGAALVVTPGNHDAMLEAVFDGTIEPAYRLADGETVVCHGHEHPDVDAERYLIGHDHPALSVDGRKRPCFLYGSGVADGTDVLVLPAFSRAVRGVTMNGARDGDLQSPLASAVDDFHPAIRDAEARETLWFPPLGACRHLL